MSEFKTEILYSKNGFTFFDESARMGVKNLGLRVSADGRTSDFIPSKTVKKGPVILVLGNAGSLACICEIRRIQGLDAATIRFTLENRSRKIIKIGDISFGIFSDDASVLVGKSSQLDMRYCHTDNVRTEYYPYCQGESPLVRSLPIRDTLLGTGEDQPFPAIYFTDRKYRNGLVIAAGSQDSSYQTWEIRKDPFASKSILAKFAIRYERCQSDILEIGPGETYEPDSTYFQILKDRHPQSAYDDYVGWLSGKLPLLGTKTPLLRHAFHCTWNYGVFDRQYEKDLLKTARFTAEKFPNIRYFLMDAGYLSKDGKDGSLAQNFVDRFYPDANAPVDAEKFPHGIRHFSDELRKLGLRPGIWWSPTARKDSLLFREHPDWFLKTRGGKPYLIGELNGYLDLTHHDARDFIDRTLSVVLRDWGMDALKMDFWSQMFEDRDGLLRNSQMSGVQTRKILFDIIRKYLPKDGIFMTCVATGMGNPFIGTHADTYRNTIDIGAGGWDEQINNCIWALPTVTIEGRKTFLLNNDSFGFNLGCPDNENFFRMTWGFITMGMQETGGRFEELPEKYVRAMRKFTDRCDRGYKCFCPDERAFTGEPLPEVLFVNYPSGSPTRQKGIVQSFAFFNWTDEPKIVSVRKEKLGHKSGIVIEDFWTGKKYKENEEFIHRRLAPRSALLYDVIRS